eukprot:CAMPEP_0113268702 /NCGR_PEP_ID=MMETSP0008_2-20120614/21318_1 /TAXON_ID=97485 /ORGANISM="Prymnesium parvum" /LENGTH=116 /DNA_ID=CAMNT_0000117889 /DNA_START=967 /DNA_END=1317 /DNA_ORIENTATION=- /assembly_acc=CAM_ASM_000153
MGMPLMSARRKESTGSKMRRLSNEMWRSTPSFRAIFHENAQNAGVHSRVLSLDMLRERYARIESLRSSGRVLDRGGELQQVMRKNAGFPSCRAGNTQGRQEFLRNSPHKLMDALMS